MNIDLNNFLKDINSFTRLLVENDYFRGHGRIFVEREINLAEALRKKVTVSFSINARNKYSSFFTGHISNEMKLIGDLLTDIEGKFEIHKNNNKPGLPRVSIKMIRKVFSLAALVFESLQEVSEEKYSLLLEALRESQQAKVILLE